MGIHACLLAVLLGASSGGTPEAPRNVLVAPDRVLEDVGQLGVVLTVQDAGEVGALVDASKLRTRVVEKLNAAGIRLVENEMSLDPRLVVRVESVPVPDAGKHVCRVQASLERLVTLPGRKDLQMRAQVWQARPIMQVVMRADGNDVISAAVLGQAEVFAGACRAARKPVSPAQDSVQDGSASDSPRSTEPAVQGLPTRSGCAFLASKSGSVFHRSTCRLAQRIADGNLVGYQTREEAVQAGRRPCKSCKP